MPKSLFSMVPDLATALELEAEELGEILLEHIQSLPPNEIWQLNRHNFFQVSLGSGTFHEYPQNQLEGVAAVFKEGWLWLEREGILITAWQPRTLSTGPHG
jgi:hypothetical protein